MKNKVIFWLVVAFVVLISMVCFFGWKLHKMTIDRDEQHNNAEELKSSLTEKDYILNLTRQELNDTIKNNATIREELRKEKIKKNKVLSITTTKIEYLPGELIEIPMVEKDTMKYVGSYHSECMTLDSCIFDMKTKTLTVIDPKYTDELTYITYLVKKDTGRKRFWIFKIKKNFIELHSFSKCGDIKVQQLTINKKK